MKSLVNECEMDEDKLLAMRYLAGATRLLLLLDSKI
jgi:hypothetical protein